MFLRFTAFPRTMFLMIASKIGSFCIWKWYSSEKRLGLSPKPETTEDFWLKPDLLDSTLLIGYRGDGYSSNEWIADCSPSLLFSSISIRSGTILLLIFLEATFSPDLFTPDPPAFFSSSWIDYDSFSFSLCSNVLIIASLKIWQNILLGPKKRSSSTASSYLLFFLLLEHFS